MEEVFHVSTHYEGAVQPVLVPEDVGSIFDVRVLMARPAVEGRDGPPRPPDDEGIFTKLTPNTQYRLECKGMLKKVEAVISGGTPAVGGGAFANVKLRDDDMSGDSMCTCVVGKVCAACAGAQGG